MTAADLSSIDTPDALADWLATGPTDDAKRHAFDQLTEAKGFDAGRRIWAVALGCSRQGREATPA